MTKKLHSKAGGAYAQSIDYRYNIRGWLTSMNDPDNIGSDLFAMELAYDDVSGLGSLTKQAQYNGNISGTIWKTHKKVNGTVSTNKGAYSYEYDVLNRLLNSYYAEGESLTPSNKYREYGFGYDKNGNIGSLRRTNSSGVLVDDLVYNYQTANTSNRLSFITENSSTSEGLLNASSFGYDANENFIDGWRDNQAITLLIIT